MTLLLVILMTRKELVRMGAWRDTGQALGVSQQREEEGLGREGALVLGAGLCLEGGLVLVGGLVLGAGPDPEEEDQDQLVEDALLLDEDQEAERELPSATGLLEDL